MLVHRTAELLQWAGGKAAILERARRDRQPLAAQIRFTDALSAQVRENLISTVLPLLRSVYDNYVALNGERTVDNSDDYDSGLDDAVERTFEPFSHLLSAQFLMVDTVDTRLHIAGETERLANRFASDVSKTLSWVTDLDEKTGHEMNYGEALQYLGFTDEDAAYIAGTATAALPPAPPQQENTPMTLDEVYSGIIASNAPILTDDVDLALAVENMFDDDDTLAAAAASTLGFLDTMGAVEAVRMANMMEGLDAAAFYDRMVELAEQAEPQAEPRAAPPAAAPAPAPVSAPAAAPSPPAAAGGVALRALQAMKANLTDQDIADALGCSRAQANAYVKGTKPLQPTPAQKASLRNLFLNHINLLIAGLGDFDATGN